VEQTGQVMSGRSLLPRMTSVHSAFGHSLYALDCRFSWNCQGSD
jgi:hypothetical protein